VDAQIVDNGTAGRGRTPIVALTAHVIGAAADAWREANMDAVLHKPFTLRALAETLGRFLVPSAAAQAPATAPGHSVSHVLAIVRRRVDLFDPQVAAQLEEFAAGGRSDFVAKVIRLYNENAPGCVSRLRASAASGDAAGSAAAAHALKSMSYNIGAKAVAAAAAEIEAGFLNSAVPESAATDRLGGLLSDTLTALGFGAVAGESEHAAGANSEAAVLLRDLKSAIANEELSLVYQPQFDPSGQVLYSVRSASALDASASRPDLAGEIHPPRRARWDDR
jgi:HPt (histidine-containing phosphotransfer) domain-containing protein